MLEEEIIQFAKEQLSYLYGNIPNDVDQLLKAKKAINNVQHEIIHNNTWTIQLKMLSNTCAMLFRNVHVKLLQLVPDVVNPKCDYEAIFVNSCLRQLSDWS